MRDLLRTCVLVAVLASAACGPSAHHGDDGPDAASDCSPEGAHQCLGSTYQTCTGGTWQTALDCQAACLDDLGCVDCHPGEQFCKDGDVWQCGPDGTPGNVVMQCTGATTCSGSSCVDACEEAASSKSYIGCEYWAVDLDNAVEVLGAQPSPFPCNDTTFGYGAGVPATKNVCFKSQGNTDTYAGLCDPPNDSCPTGYTCQSKAVCILNAQSSPFAIVVSNPNPKDANVTVTGPGGQTINKVVPAGQVLPILPQAGNAIPDASIDGTIKTRAAYKVVSDRPIVAYQFNPLDNVDVFSNDASLLIPRTAFDTDYYAMSYPTLDRRTVQNAQQIPQHNYYGYLTVVAWQDNTQIEVTPTTAIQASASQATIAAGVTTTFTLNAFDVLNLEAAPGTAPVGDVTGTHISSPNMMSFGVFAGHEATNFGETTAPDSTHTSGPCCADHLEEMMFPSSTWGKEFAISRSQQRTNEPDMLRILAQKPNTTVTFTPAPASGTCGTLNAGQFCQVKISGDTEIVSTEPILVGHYLEASMWRDNPFFGIPTWVGSGDPSMAIAVPTEQYRKDYAILVPSQYAKSYMSVSAASTGGVFLDGTAVTLAAFPGGGTHRAARVMLSPGPHKITCPDGCGITVYGYDDAVSYMFAGGLDLKPIVIF